MVTCKRIFHQRRTSVLRQRRIVLNSRRAGEGWSETSKAHLEGWSWLEARAIRPG